MLLPLTFLQVGDLILWRLSYVGGHLSVARLFCAISGGKSFLWTLQSCACRAPRAPNYACPTPQSSLRLPAWESRCSFLANRVWERATLRGRRPGLRCNPAAVVAPPWRIALSGFVAGAPGPAPRLRALCLWTRGVDAVGAEAHAIIPARLAARACTCGALVRGGAVVPILATWPGLLILGGYARIACRIMSSPSEPDQGCGPRRTAQPDCSATSTT